MNIYHNYKNNVEERCIHKTATSQKIITSENEENSSELDFDNTEYTDNEIQQNNDNNDKCDIQLETKNAKEKRKKQNPFSCINEKAEEIQNYKYTQKNNKNKRKKKNSISPVKIRIKNNT